MMAPIRYKKMERVGNQNVEQEVEIDGMNKVRRDYFLSIGENVDRIHTMSYDEYLFFSSIIEQLQH
jgi:hypothetical protein